MPEPYLPTLRLFFEGNQSNEYRLIDHHVEFRNNHGAWRSLRDTDIQLHHVLRTEVSKWLQRENEHADQTNS